MKFALALVLATTACWTTDPKLERKIDDVSAQLVATQRELESMRKALSTLANRPEEEPQPPTATLERRIDELNKKIDVLVATPPRLPPPMRREPDRSKTYALKVDGHPSEGPSDAKITIVMAHDYADPYSDRSRSTLADLRKKYGQDLRIVYRDFVVHPQIATAGALASCAAHAQGKFSALDPVLWEEGFKARAFDRNVDRPDGASEQCWKTADGCPVVLGFARKLKLDVARFKADMVKCEPKIQADMQDLQAFAVAATPTFFINGRVLTGAMPAEQFETLIDEELAKANERIQLGTPKAAYYKTWVLDKGLPKLEPATP